MKTLNEPFSKLSMRRRYEVWFLRLGLADGSGAWWFRYLLMSPGRDGCRSDPRQQPVQVWATWFPRNGKAQTWIQGLPLRELHLSARGKSPLLLEAGENRISENECRGRLDVDGHRICWDLRCCSTLRVELSSKGWIGFSRTPHSDAVFSGEITLDGQTFRGDPLAYGMQGHNCGYRHRKFWTWAHIYFPCSGGTCSTVEALVYEMPLGLTFRTVVIWHEGREHVFRHLQNLQWNPSQLVWSFFCLNPKVSAVKVEVHGRKGFIHHLPYFKTDCSGQFEVANDSLASARMTWYTTGNPPKELSTDIGAVIEMTGSPSVP